MHHYTAPAALCNSRGGYTLFEFESSERRKTTRMDRKNMVYSHWSQHCYRHHRAVPNITFVAPLSILQSIHSAVAYILGLKCSLRHTDYKFVHSTVANSCMQGVTKRCCLSWLVHWALLYEPKCEGKGGGCGVSANEYS